MAMRFNSPSFKTILDQMTALVHFAIEFERDLFTADAGG